VAAPCSDHGAAATPHDGLRETRLVQVTASGCGGKGRGYEGTDTAASRMRRSFGRYPSCATSWQLRQKTVLT